MTEREVLPGQFMGFLVIKQEELPDYQEVGKRYGFHIGIHGRPGDYFPVISTKVWVRGMEPAKVPEGMFNASIKYVRTDLWSRKNEELYEDLDEMIKKVKEKQEEKNEPQKPSGRFQRLRRKISLNRFRPL